MFAGHLRGDNLWWYPHLNARYPEAYGVPPEPVTVTEDPYGDYWGWIATDSDHPDFIYPNEGLFSMCFTYGYHAEEKAGKGRAVQLTVTPGHETVGPTE